MTSQLRRRMIMAAGACIAGAAMPIAIAFNAWADDLEITYDGKIIFDNFANAPSYGASDTGTLAESGTNNDWAIVYAPATDTYATDGVLANDSATTDSGDYAYFSGDTTPSAGAFFGNEGAQITNATNSDAEVYGGGNAVIDPASFGGQDAVTASSAIATNGGTALVSNGLTTTTPMTGDYAFANGGNAAPSPTHPPLEKFSTVITACPSPTTQASTRRPLKVARPSIWPTIATPTLSTRAALPTLRVVS
jgi:hypothetical protein